MPTGETRHADRPGFGRKGERQDPDQGSHPGAGLTEIKDREEYLKKQAEAQYEVDQGKLVDAVREVLARHDVKWG